ncbi:hypothetical protein HAX54_035561, partial [Datura stramonium]|nr:hypothetical protein [Datura stramonium]
MHGSNLQCPVHPPPFVNNKSSSASGRCSAAQRGNSNFFILPLFDSPKTAYGVVT